MFQAISPDTRSRAWQVALGWPIGLTLEILAFSLTAAIGARDLFWAYPLAVGIPAAVVLRRRTRASPPGRSPIEFAPACRWTLAGLCIVAFSYIGLAFYAEAPLPGSVDSAFYFPDIPFHIALAAEALHHWPIEAPNVVGQPLHYHYFAHIHVAAISQVTDIGVDRVLLRLWMLPLTALFVLQLSLLGKAITGRAWAGPLAVALYLFVHELDVSVHDQFPWTGIGMFHLWESPSQLLGMVLFIPALAILCSLVDREVTARSRPGLELRPSEAWAVLVVLLIGAGGAKSVVLPLFIGALALYLVWVRFRRGVLDRTAAVALGLSAVIYLGYLAVLYGRETLGLRLDPTGTPGQMLPLVRLHLELGSVPGFAFWAVAIPLGTFMYFAAPLLGGVWARRTPEGRRPAAVLSICFLIATLPAFFLLQSYGFNQTYFALFGLLAAYPIAAGGLLAFFGDGGGRLPSPRWTLGLAAGWIAFVAIVAMLADRLVARSHPLQADAVQYTAVGLAILLLVAAALLARGRRRTVLGGLAALALLLTAMLDTPLDVIPKDARALIAGRPLYDQSAGLTRSEAEGLHWIRDHTDSDAVLAASHTSYPWKGIDNGYPAFGERRTLLEGWMYTTRSSHIGQLNVYINRLNPFERRRRLEHAVFSEGNRQAAGELSRLYGVTHLVVQRPGPRVDPRVYRMGLVVYSRDGFTVIALPPS